MRLKQWLLVSLGLTLCALTGSGQLSAQAREVTGAFTINGTAHPMTNAYAFARRNGLGEDQGVKILFTSAPVPADVIRGYVNNSWIQDKALKGELIALEIVMLPDTITAARAAAGVRTCCQSNFYAKGLITEDLSYSISGTQQVVLTTAPADRIAGRARLEKTSNAKFGGGATLEYDLTFNTRLLTSKSAFGPWAH